MGTWSQTRKASAVGLSAKSLGCWNRLVWAQYNFQIKTFWSLSSCATSGLVRAEHSKAPTKWQRTMETNNIRRVPTLRVLFLQMASRNNIHRFASVRLWGDGDLGSWRCLWVLILRLLNCHKHGRSRFTHVSLVTSKAGDDGTKMLEPKWLWFH